MTKTITFVKSDMSKPFMDLTSCPIYTALARKGVPVSTVGGDAWLDESQHLHKFSRRLNQASSLLADTDYPDSRRTRTRKGLIGRSYRVTY